MKPIVFYDVETTGTDVQKDRIVQISLIKVRKDQQKETMTMLINPEMTIPETVTAIHGISNEDVKDSMKFHEAAPTILAFIHECDMCGYNSNRFDLPLLYSEMIRVGIAWNYKEHQHIDVNNIYKRMRPRTLAAAFKELTGAELENAHDAEADVIATIAVLEALSKEGIKDDNGNKIVGRGALAYFSNFDSKIVDLGGMFKHNENGEIVFAKGKHIGKSPLADLNYLYWMQKSDFMPDTKEVVRGFIAQIKARAK